MAKKKAASLRRAGRKSVKSAAASKSSRFVKDLLVRGEAAKPGKDGKLPLSATHAIVKENPDGTVEVKRARYKLF
ncbi:MAG: hypothetical protein C5B51_29560 [Terriglobia bacterium]|nr:MAG: hypothetical protein C5B51_29560 [Terriglobia bacterium]